MLIFIIVQFRNIAVTIVVANFYGSGIGVRRNNDNNSNNIKINNYYKFVAQLVCAAVPLLYSFILYFIIIINIYII